MCAGLAALCGPPSIACGCYMLYRAGQDFVMRRAQMNHRPPMSSLTVCSGVATLIASYQAQLKVLVRHFDEGGALSLDWKRGAESLGEPLKIQTWRQFYRAAGPPVFARTAAVLVSFYASGVFSTVVAGHFDRSHIAQHRRV